MEGAKIIVDVFSCLVEMMIAAFFFSAFKERRVSKKLLLAVIFFTASLFLLSRTLMVNSGQIFVVSLVLTFSVSLCYSFKIQVALLMSMLISVFSALSDLVTTMLFVLSGVKPEAKNANIYVYILAIIMSDFITGIVVVIVQKGRHKLFQSAKKNNFIGILMLPLATVLIITLFWKFFDKYTTDVAWQIVALATIVFLIIANVMIFYTVDRQHELITARQKLKTSHVILKSQCEYYDSMFESQQEIRTIRHNLKNIFIAVLSCIESGEYDEAKRMLQNQLMETQRDVYPSSNQTDNIINSVIYSKKAVAESQDIDLKFKLDILAHINLDYLDVAVMLGNLLDNAIEATSQIEKPHRKITFQIFADNNNFSLSIENPTKNEVNVKRIETTKSDEKNHGFGLLSVRTIVEKYKGNVIILCTEGMFSVEILIKNDECAL